MRYVYWYIVSMDKDFSYVSLYLTKHGWSRSARKNHPTIFKSLHEARGFYSKLPFTRHPRIRIWASGSRAKQTMFHPCQGRKYNDPD